MGDRLWRTATTCAAVLLATTSCVVGPTITDNPPKPAAADPATYPSQPDPPQGGNPPPNGSSTAGAAPGMPTPVPSSRTTAAPTYVIGGDVPFKFADGSQVVVVQALVDVNTGAGPGGLVRVVVRLNVYNGTDRPLWGYRLDVQLRACADPTPKCERDKSAVTATGVEAAKYVQKGETKSVDWFFAASPDKLSAITVEVGDPKSVRAEFTGSATQTP
jgi:hypothetical protein